MLDSVITVTKKYYPQTLLEECKYEIKKTKMGHLTNDDLDLSSSQMMKPIVNLIMRLNLIMMNSLLKFKTVI